MLRLNVGFPFNNVFICLEKSSYLYEGRKTFQMFLASYFLLIKENVFGENLY